MANPNLVRKPAIDSGSVGELSTSQVATYNNAYKNLFINGNFDFWQRNTSFNSSGTGQFYAADRWLQASQNTAARTITKSSAVPNLDSTSSLLFTVTTADTSVGATDYELLGQRIEGNIFKAVYGKTFTISFWVRGSTPGTYSVACINGLGTRSYVAPFTINAAGVWEFKTMTITHDTSGTWSLDNSSGMQVFICLMAGTTFQGTANTWQSANVQGVAGQVNLMSTVGNYINVSQMMLNVGSTASPFQTFGQDLPSELIACQRYFEKSYPLDIPPGSAGQLDNGQYEGIAINTVDFYDGYNHDRGFLVLKRATPTVITYNPQTGNSGNYYNHSQGTVQGNSGVRRVSVRGVGFYSTNGGLTTSNVFGTHWTADAEL